MTSGLGLNRSASNSFSVPEIVKLAEDGVLRIPSFQRNYVWRTSDVRALFDSLFRGFPVGTLLLWERYGPAGRVSFGPIEFDAPEHTDALWVVDGQQRITSLVGALSSKLQIKDDRFNVCFDLSTSKFVNTRRGVAPPRSIPVREAMETRSLLTWLRLHGSDLEPEDLDVADKLGGALRDYKIPAYIVAEDNQKVLREVFDRVNNSGKPISRAQVFHALFANEEAPGSPASVVESLSHHGFGEIRENTVVQSLLGIRGGDIQRDIHDEFSDEETALEWYDLTEQAILRAIDFLRGQGVSHVSLMPNAVPIPILATFFHLHPEPSPWILRLLSWWLWRGWAHGFGKEGGHTPVLRRAIRSIYRDKGKIEEIPTEYEAAKSLLAYTADRVADADVPDDFRTDRAESRLVLLALASLKPLSDRGEPLDIGALLDAHGIDAISEIVKGHRTDAAARMFWPLNAPRITLVNSREILDSHAISPQARQALVNGETDDFLKLRRADLSRVLKDFLSNRMETGAVVRPPLGDLLILDGEDDD